MAPSDWGRSSLAGSSLMMGDWAGPLMTGPLTMGGEGALGHGLDLQALTVICDHGTGWVAGCVLSPVLSASNRSGRSGTSDIACWCFGKVRRTGCDSGRHRRDWGRSLKSKGERV
eukprot:364437-Chlamydomonas_euryale.AAC.5